MAAIHTTSQSFTFALYRLAANPEWILRMREEVESVVKAEGWTKSAMQKMHHVDSFLKECQRCDGIVTINMTRVAMKDYTFSDGTFIPKGTFVSAAVTPMHNDEEYYADATVFNPWRFAELRDGEGESLKHQMASTNKEYLAFGHGKDACPGRFFATNSLKVMLAHLVLNYDIKFEEEGVLPKSLRIATMHTPNAKAKVLFRKRQH
ncbi:hypothetical protein QCA50_000127 [Cerrena zonata]|uniref:Cytochrome P450 n=1 Tax=Cerrena zonata TaxID=2478898 RepID=A0AAW0GZH8_9APHY